MKIVKGILLVIGVLFGIVVVGVGGVFAYMKTPPSPAEVCAHIAQFSENPTLAASPAGLTACQERLAPPTYGQLPYARAMRCLEGAESREELDACGR